MAKATLGGLLLLCVSLVGIFAILLKDEDSGGGRVEVLEIYQGLGSLTHDGRSWSKQQAPGVSEHGHGEHKSTWAHGAIQGSFHQDWNFLGRSVNAAADPLNGKPLLVADRDHPGYVKLSKDALLRQAQYRRYLRRHPHAQGLVFPERSLSNLDADEYESPKRMGKLSLLGVNV